MRCLGASDLALDEAVGARLGSVHLGVLAGVLVALVPAEVCHVLLENRFS